MSARSFSVPMVLYVTLRFTVGAGVGEGVGVEVGEGVGVCVFVGVLSTGDGVAVGRGCSLSLEQLAKQKTVNRIRAKIRKEIKCFMRSS